ncbi:MAG: hypothetical protein O7D95_03030 [Betaproteobacteria bacterium]|nr:hypothetical protein [Betaproteobacteria bacterium]
MKTKLRENWKPSEEYFWTNLANKHAMTNFGSNREWVVSHFYEIKMYWCAEMGGCGKIMANWNWVFWKRLLFLWEKVDKSRLYREVTAEELKPYLDEMNNKTIPKIIESRKKRAKARAEDKTVFTQTLTGTEIADMLKDIS